MGFVLFGMTFGSPLPELYNPLFPADKSKLAVLCASHNPSLGPGVSTEQSTLDGMHNPQSMFCFKL